MDRSVAPVWAAVIVGVVALVIATAALTASLVGGPSNQAGPVGYGHPAGAMMGGGMMWGYGPAGAGVLNGPGPGEAGFVAGTSASPRVVRVIAGPGLAFTPSTISVARGETVTFLVTTMGPAVHEFMVGPADAVAADREGTPEVAGIGMMATRALTYTFDGTGPYAFACHATGHYEAGMRGTITLVG